MTQQSRVAVYFDPPSQHFLGDRFFDGNFAAHGGDQILAPYIHVKRVLEARGIPVRTADYLPSTPNGVRNLYFSFGILSNYERLAKRKDVTLSGFFAMECPTVDPKMYRELNRAQEFFKRIFSWSDSQSLEPFVGGTLRCLPLHWPQSFESVHEEIWRRTERDFLVMINGNKLPRHRSHCRELYSERMKAIEFFSQTAEIDLYGIGWDGPTFRLGPAFLPGTFEKVRVPGTLQGIRRQLTTYWQRLVPEPRLMAARKVYRGFSKSKSETLGKYTFAICFENSILKGWITEKIFDCFFAGTVPVYWGAPDVTDYIPGGAFIDKREHSTYAELRGHLKSLTEKDIEGYKGNAREFLASERFKPFSKESFARIFTRAVEEDLGVKS
jgi:hypothetical protein